jgi:hypothetical protein
LKHSSLGAVLVLGWIAFSGIAFADRGESTATPASKEKGAGQEGVAEEAPSPWAGSILIFDQSATTQTIGLGKDYQSYDPTYELWFALKPRYKFYDDGTTTMSVGAWANLYLELTNSDTTTTRREPLLGPTLVTGSVGRKLFENGEYKTSMSIGPRLGLPTDKESRAAGRYFSLGASGGVTQSVPINGKDAPSFNTLRFELSTIYGHAFNNSTTSWDPNLNQPRQDISGRLISDNQLGGSMAVHDALSLRFGADAQLTPKLDFGVAYVLAYSWHYAPPAIAGVQTAIGVVVPETIDNPTSLSVSPWAIASLDYDVLDEMTLSIGYYNKTNQIGPDGQRRSPLWSPDARVFLSVTGNLDVIAKDLRAHKAPPSQSASTK